MVNSNNFNYFDEAIVERTNYLYKVELVEENTSISKSRSIVEQIGEQSGQDNSLIAILLAYIEYVRRINSLIGRRGPTQFDDDIMTEVIINLLEYFSIEELISKVKSSNWYELSNVFESNNPIENMMKL